jgi:Domain of unknown function (DUF5069)
MDLTKTVPRSPNEQMLGLVSLKRTIDKAKAFNEGKLGEYDYDCPHDKPLFEFLGTDGAEFAKKVAELETDEKIAQWLTPKLADKTPAQIADFDERRRQWHPEPGSHGEEYFNGMREQLAPGRTDIVTWFDLLDLDERRPVSNPTKIKELR